jgi:hypothetical protein
MGRFQAAARGGAREHSNNLLLHLYFVPLGVPATADGDLHQPSMRKNLHWPSLDGNDKRCSSGSSAGKPVVLPSALKVRQVRTPNGRCSL